MAVRLFGGPHLSVRRPGRGDRPGPAFRQPGARRQPRARIQRALSRTFLPGAAAHRPAAAGGVQPRGRRAGRAPGPAGGRHQRRALPQGRRFRRPRGARLHPGRPRADRQPSPAALHRPAVPALGRGDGQPVRRHPRGAREQRRDRAALQSAPRVRPQLPAGLSTAGRRGRRRPARAPGARRPGGAPRPHGRARAACPPAPVRRAAGARASGHHPDGLRRLLPDRRRFHPVGARQRRAGRPGRGSGAGSWSPMRSASRRPRPDPLRAAVRALPESGARVAAGLRHRLLHRGPRPGDRLRDRALRPRPGGADHYPRHHGRARRWCATSGACSTIPTATSTSSPS
jgi:hypothetical protein